MSSAFKNQFSALSEANEAKTSSKGLEHLGQLEAINLSVIEPDPEQIRQESNEGFSNESIEELALNIIDIGLWTPILVQKKKGEELFKIIDGERRFRACKIAEKETIPAFVVSEDIDPEDLQTVLNLLRVPNTAKELSDKIQSFQKQGLTQQQIAKKVGKSQGLISQYLSVEKWPDFLKEAFFDKKKVKEFTDAYELYRLSKKQAHLVQDWIEEQDVISASLIKAFKKLLKEEKIAALQSEDEETSFELQDESENESVLQGRALAEENSSDEDFSLTEPEKEIFTPSVVDGNAITLSNGDSLEDEESEELPFSSSKNEKLLATNSERNEDLVSRDYSQGISKQERKDEPDDWGGDFAIPVSPAEDVAEKAEERIINPKLIVEFYGKRALLLLHKKPSAEDKVWIKYHIDGLETEVLGEQIKFKSLLEG